MLLWKDYLGLKISVMLKSRLVMYSTQVRGCATGNRNGVIEVGGVLFPTIPSPHSALHSQDFYKTHMSISIAHYAMSDTASFSLATSFTLAHSNSL
jgi:hypothetical protein